MAISNSVISGRRARKSTSNYRVRGYLYPSQTKLRENAAAIGHAALVTTIQMRVKTRAMTEAAGPEATADSVAFPPIIFTGRDVQML